MLVQSVSFFICLYSNYLSFNIDSSAKCPSPLDLMNPDKLTKVLSDLVALPFSSTLFYLFILKILRK